TQLNDSTAFSFNATLVSAGLVDTVAELSAFNAVVIGSTGIGPPAVADPFDNAAFTSALRTWVEAGGGVVMSGPGVWGAGSSSGPAIPDIDAIIPVNTSGASIANNIATVTINTTVHAVTSGVTSFPTAPGDPPETPAGGADPGATILGTANAGPPNVVGHKRCRPGGYQGPGYVGPRGVCDKGK